MVIILMEENILRFAIVLKEFYFNSQVYQKEIQQDKSIPRHPYFYKTSWKSGVHPQLKACGIENTTFKLKQSGHGQVNILYNN